MYLHSRRINWGKNVDQVSFWNRIVTPRIGIGSDREVPEDSHPYSVCTFFIFWFGVNISQLFSQWYPLEPTRREKINWWNELATQNCSIYYMESCLYGIAVLYFDKIAMFQNPVSCVHKQLPSREASLPLKAGIHYMTFKIWTDFKNTRHHTLADLVNGYREKLGIIH